MGYHDAYMAGQHKADRDHYIQNARVEMVPECKSHWVMAARRSHRNYLKSLRMALNSSNGGKSWYANLIR
jgi:hypothetical protein